MRPVLVLAVAQLCVSVPLRGLSLGPADDLASEMTDKIRDYQLRFGHSSAEVELPPEVKAGHPVRMLKGECVHQRRHARR